MSNYLNSYKKLFTPVWIPASEVNRITPRLFIERLISKIVIWNERARSRRQLATLDRRLLKDIGMTEQNVYDEVNKPFWVE